MALTKVSGNLQSGATVNASDFGASASGSAASNTTALQTALNSLTNGGTLVISEDLDINGEVQIPYNGIEITSDSAALITQTVAGLRVFYGVDISDITIRGITIDGTDSSVAYNGAPLDGNGEGAIHITTSSSTPSNIRVYDCEIFNAFTGISVTYSANVWIEGCKVRNFYKFGILVSKSYNFHIDNNNVFTCEQEVVGQNTYGIMGTGNSIAAGDIQQRCSITNNVIDYVRLWDGIMTHDCDDLVISGNHITNVRTGVDISYSTGITSDIQNIIVTDNFIEITTTDVWGGTAASTSGVLIVGDDSATVYIDRCIVSNNIIKDYNKMAGFTPSGDVVSAIRLDTIRNVTVSSNLIVEMGNASTAVNPIGIFVPTENLKIEGNQISGGFQSNGVLIYGTNTGVYNNLSIQNNSLYNTNATAITTNKLINFEVVGGGTTATWNNVAISGNLSNLDNKIPVIGSGVTVNYAPDANFSPSAIGMADGIAAPSTITGMALLFVDTADGDLKIKFGDGTLKTIVTDT